MERELTTGNVLSKITRFSIPILLGNVLQQLYNIIDSIIVGQFVGKDAFAAVGATGSINFLIIGFVVGLSCGLCIPIAQYFGAGKYVEMRKMIAAATYVSIVIGLVITVGTTFGAYQMLMWMKTPENIIREAHTFIFIIFLGIPATLLYNLPANISRSLGDSKTPLYFLIISVFINIILDFIFVCGFSMGVEGTAIATVVSQAIGGILCILYMKKKYSILVYHKEEWVPNLALSKHSAGIGIPMGLQFSITAIGTVVLQSAVNVLGSDTVAAVNAAMKIQMVFVQPLEAIGLTIATYCGQNLGAGKINRIYEGVRKALIACSVCAVVAFVCSNVLAMPISMLFMKQEEMNPYIRQCIKQILLYNSFFYFLLGSLLVLRNALQGLGHSIIAMGAGLFEMIARCMIAFLSITSFGYTAICFSNPMAWVAANLILIPLYFIIAGKLKKTYMLEQARETS